MKSLRFFVALFLYGNAVHTQTPFERFRARLSIDYGPRQVGLAVSDPFGNIEPLCTIPNDGDLCELSLRVVDIARTRGAVEVVLGLPLDSNGKMSYNVRNFNGRLCLDFSKVLSSIVGRSLPRTRTVLFDERYTTREAKQKARSERKRGELHTLDVEAVSPSTFLLFLI
jgi:RNase H-fold protein (predicted Holliday junction resolvase)